MIETWLAAIRDHPQRPPASQQDVLTKLALRLDWSTGTGYASTAALMADSGVTERTVRNATAWARKAGLLVLLERGHRRGDGTVSASRWQLPQPARRVGLSNSQPANSDTSTGTPGRTIKNPRTQESNLIDFVIREVHKQTDKTISTSDAERCIRTVRERASEPIRDPFRYFAKSIANHPLWFLPTSTPRPYTPGGPL